MSDHELIMASLRQADRERADTRRAVRGAMKQADRIEAGLDESKKTAIAWSMNSWLREEIESAKATELRIKQRQKKIDRLVANGIKVSEFRAGIVSMMNSSIDATFDDLVVWMEQAMN